MRHNQCRWVRECLRVESAIMADHEDKLIVEDPYTFRMQHCAPYEHGCNALVILIAGDKRSSLFSACLATRRHPPYYFAVHA